MIEPAGQPRHAEELVPDVRHLTLAVGTRVLVTSDFHLRDRPTQASTWAVTELLKVLEAWEGPGVLVFAGDLVELWAGEDYDRFHTALDAHPEFVQAVSSFAAGDGRTVLYLVGNHDGCAAWDEATIAEAMDRLGCEISLAAEIDVQGVGSSTVRMEHGHSTDPRTGSTTLADPYASPLGQHIVQEFLPSFTQAEGDWLDGVETLADPRTFPAFISSRLFYRKLAFESLWFLIPVMFILLLRLPLAYVLWNGKLQKLRPFSRVLFIADLVINRQHRRGSRGPDLDRAAHLEDRQYPGGSTTRRTTERQHTGRGRGCISVRAVRASLRSHPPASSPRWTVGSTPAPASRRSWIGWSPFRDPRRCSCPPSNSNT